ncbi:hypothetical protein F7731_23500 [Cytobacillus depressus]|uniref:Uncharacterized protein n=1 Tax=Cytobacillus depressus TaxID=1602942 RepID=A0A6L3UXR6_9BACI|nr:hypothetical protein [Cytobacillus depressus]KAB2328922.1 hypothetical protein F7731_23500 [Cytobacillus depressus]
MPQIQEVSPTSLTILCDCGETFVQDIENFNPKFVDEFGQYENLTTDPCPNCGMQHIFNMNLPETGLEEQELEEEPWMPPNEKALRAKIRGLMWLKRPDLKGKNLQKLLQEKKAFIEEKKKMSLPEIREEFLERQRRIAEGLPPEERGKNNEQPARNSINSGTVNKN